MAERKSILLRLDPAVHDALARWAAADLRSTNAQIEFLLRRALADSGRMPGGVARIRGRGRPRIDPDPATTTPADPADPNSADPHQADPHQAGPHPGDPYPGG